MSFALLCDGFLEFEGNNKKKYKIKPISFQGLGTFINWLKFFPYNQLLSAPESEYKAKLLEECYTACAKKVINLDSSEMFTGFTNPTCVSKLLLITFQETNPGITEREVEEIISFGNRKNWMQLFNYALGVEITDKEGESLGQLIET